MTPNNEPTSRVTVMDLYNLAESLDNAVLHDGKPMTPEDKYRRRMLAALARQLLRNVGFYR